MTQAPFEESLSALARVAMRYTGAEGFVYLRRSETGGLVRSSGCGTFIRDDSLSGQGPQSAVSFPLRLHGVVDGLLAFSFPDKTSLEAARPCLDPLIATIEKVWTAPSTAQSNRHLLECIIELETGIIDSKVVSRARGVLGGEPDKEGVDAIIRHVDTVLRSSQITRALRQILEELQKEAEERDWSERAKSILQRLHGMSEEEAYSYMRKASRHSRKRFADVARQIVEEGQ